MAARVIAGIVLLAGLAVLALVGLRSSDEPGEVVAAESADASGDNTEAATTSVPVTEVLVEAPENFGPRKDLVDLDGWRNTEATSIDDFDGKVLLVEMWTFGCSNCKARIPHNQELYANLRRDDFDIIGVHAPEFDFEADIANIEDAIDRLGVTWPVAIDTNKTNFRAWQEGGRRFWPRTYVVDQNGDVRYDHIGEGRYDELARTINYLIDNPPATTS